MGTDYTQGLDILVEIAPRGADRTEPATGFLPFRGTQITLNLTGSDFQTTVEFSNGGSTGNKVWEDGEVNIRGWNVSFSGKFKTSDPARAVIRDASKATGKNAEVYLRFYPAGNATGEELYKGIVSISDYSVEGSNDGEVTFSCTMTGRGELDISTIA